jgi:transposase
LAIENSAEILESYKQQQNVEQGFRFLKDPWFMADTMFLKSPRRIEALMMVMTLCLMIYNISQHRMRVALEEQNETIPNQLGKQTSTPTLRWAFQLMEGVIVARELLQTHETRTTYFNLNALRVKIVRLFGPLACEIYGSA